MRWTLRQIATAVGGRVDPAADVRRQPVDRLGDGDGPPPVGPEQGDGLFGPITIDSREVGEGAVFVPIVAERDGHDFIAAALDAGAGAYLYMPDHHDPRTLDDRMLGDRTPDDRTAGHRPPAIAVAGTGDALLDLGRAARSRLPGPVVGITGSVGKTSTKDLAAATVGASKRVTASAKSFNNELGVPLTLANAAPDTEVSIVEMGARGIGHIALLCDVARPTVAVVTAVAAVHTELFGDLDAVAEAKGELVEALPASGTAILNGNDGRVSAMASRTAAEVVLYGVAGASGATGLDVVAEHVTLDDELRARYHLRSPWGRADVALGVHGAHQVGNSLAALAVALRLGVDLGAAVGTLTSTSASPWRMELATTPSGAKVLNDAYNANPTSMLAALEGLARLPASRRIAVLGEMAELGDDGAAEHHRIAEAAAGMGIEVVAVGTPEYGRPPVADVEEAAAALGPLTTGDAVLVKASRVAGLERLAALLLGQPGSAPSP